MSPHTRTGKLVKSGMDKRLYVSIYLQKTFSGRADLESFCSFLPPFQSFTPSAVLMQLLVDLWGNQTTEMIYLKKKKKKSVSFFKADSLASLQQNRFLAALSLRAAQSLVKRWEEAPRGEKESEGASGSLHQLLVPRGALLRSHPP